MHDVRAFSPRDAARYRVGVAYWVLKVLLSPIFYLMWRMKVEGREHVPATGPVILAPNHVTFWTRCSCRWCCAGASPSWPRPSTSTRGRRRGSSVPPGQIPMRREGGSASERALAAARDVLKAGKVLGIYPEGTRSPDGRLYRGHTGVARLALGCGAPVIPVGLVGTSEVQPPGSNRPRPFKKVTVRFGAPLDLSRFDGESAGDPLDPAGRDRRVDVRDPQPVGPDLRRPLRQAPRRRGRRRRGPGPHVDQR